MTRLFKTVSLFTLSLTHVLVWGQSLNGKISGLISDSGGAAISQVAVTVWNEETGAQRRLVTGSSGIYVVAELPAGYYRVRFEAPGLSTMRLQRVKVDVGSETRVDVTFLADNLPLNGWDGWPTRKIEYIADRWRRHGSARI